MPSSRPSALRVLVVDDHELIRLGLTLALNNQEDLELVGTASNGAEALTLVEDHHPDVVVLDLQMPVMDGLSAAQQIKARHPNTQIIAYSSLEDPQAEVMAQAAKVDVFCEKGTGTGNLINLIRQLGNQQPKQV
ncbi:response regulator transcription factor [Leptolyngbya sp. FACHB-261]|uniref:response regulator n=1 Tax=Leptolyngbya sp. FACHB-261 TaxID=2692806 RepID=UPI001689F258|nr:response regulator transcription factor [Leptolyngbya sp. FACHB-261]MBD2101175.1 response regulator transcription factor [Leptolyngbya sp. FACHB-261]